MNLFVGVHGVAGPPMVQRMAGLTVHAQRPLRDLFKKLPSLQLHVVVREGGWWWSSVKLGQACTCYSSVRLDTPLVSVPPLLSV